MRSTISVAVLGLVGCITPLRGPAASIKDADGTELAGCEFLGEHSASASSGNEGANAIQDAKNKVRNSVASLGATHINWHNAIQGAGGTTVTGRVYRCPSK